MRRTHTRVRIRQPCADGIPITEDRPGKRLKVEQQPETEAISLDSTSSAPVSTQPAVPRPRPAAHPTEDITEQQAYRSFRVRPGAVLHIQVLTADGRATFVTVEGSPRATGLLVAPDPCD